MSITVRVENIYIYFDKRDLNENNIRSNQIINITSMFLFTDEIIRLSADRILYE